MLELFVGIVIIFFLALIGEIVKAIFSSSIGIGLIVVLLLIAFAGSADAQELPHNSVYDDTVMEACSIDSRIAVGLYQRVRNWNIHDARKVAEEVDEILKRMDVDGNQRERVNIYIQVLLKSEMAYGHRFDAGDYEYLPIFICEQQQAYIDGRLR